MIWLNGKLLPAPDQAIDATDRGFTLGDGLFETIRVSNGKPRFFDRHMARLSEGGTVLGIAIPDVSVFDQAITDTLDANALTDAAIRITVTRGPAARGLVPVADNPPTVLVTAYPLPPPTKPARLIIAQSTRRNEFSPLSRIKSLNYLDNILARIEAERAGTDDALLLNSTGLVTEATAANLFVQINGELLTPPVNDGALPGIIRGVLVEQGLAIERSLTRALLDSVEAGFLSNALGFRPIQQIAGRILPIEGKAQTDQFWQRHIA